jgi:hypothetical protein
MHQPTKVAKQSVQAVLADLKIQAARLTEAIAWTENVSKAIQGSRQVQFTNAGPIEPGCREAGIAFSLPAGSVSQDVLVFTLVSTPSEEEIAAMRRETALASEGLRLANLLNWQAQGVRTFETWFVDTPSIWQDSPEATQVFLTKSVKAWLAYWFETPPTPIFRTRTLRVQPLR